MKPPSIASRNACLTLILLGGIPGFPRIHAELLNGDFSSTTLTHGNGEANSLGLGWYAKNADNGLRADPDPVNWSTGATIGTPGILTQLSNSGSKTRAGQFFTNELTGTGWSFEFDLGGTGTLELLRVWAGTLAASPSGRALNGGSDAAPAAGLVDANGWTEIVNSGAITRDPGPRSYVINQDLGDFDVMVVKLRARGSGPGTTYHNFKFVKDDAPAAITITSVMRVGPNLQIAFTAAPNTRYKLTESADLEGAFQDPLPAVGTTTGVDGTGTLHLPIAGALNFARVESD